MAVAKYVFARAERFYFGFWIIREVLLTDRIWY